MSFGGKARWDAATDACASGMQAKFQARVDRVREKQAEEANRAAKRQERAEAPDMEDEEPAPAPKRKGSRGGRALIARSQSAPAAPGNAFVESILGHQALRSWMRTGKTQARVEDAAAKLGLETIVVEAEDDPQLARRKARKGFVHQVMRFEQAALCARLSSHCGLRLPPPFLSFNCIDCARAQLERYEGFLMAFYEGRMPLPVRAVLIARAECVRADFTGLSARCRRLSWIQLGARIRILVGDTLFLTGGAGTGKSDVPRVVGDDLGAVAPILIAEYGEGLHQIKIADVFDMSLLEASAAAQRLPALCAEPLPAILESETAAIEQLQEAPAGKKPKKPRKKKATDRLDLSFPFGLARAASTGLAAFQIGGVTLYALMGLGRMGADASNAAANGVDTFLQDLRLERRAQEPDVRAKWRLLTMVHVDEFSMVSAELLEKFDRFARLARNLPDVAFGGLQVVASGDNLQLPPVLKRDSEAAISAKVAETLKEAGEPVCTAASLWNQRQQALKNIPDSVLVRSQSSFALASAKPQAAATAASNSQASDVVSCVTGKPIAAEPTAAQLRAGRIQRRRNDTSFCFCSASWHSLFPAHSIVLLHDVFRQHEEVFLRVLNEARQARLSQDTMTLLRAIKDHTCAGINARAAARVLAESQQQGYADYAAQRALDNERTVALVLAANADDAADAAAAGLGEEEGDELWRYPSLHPLRKTVDSVNNARLQGLAAKTPLRVYASHTVDAPRSFVEADAARKLRNFSFERLAPGDDPNSVDRRRELLNRARILDGIGPTEALAAADERDPVPRSLAICIGAKVQLTQNLDQTRGLVNSRRGVVIDFEQAVPPEPEPEAAPEDGADGEPAEPAAANGDDEVAAAKAVEQRARKRAAVIPGFEFLPVVLFDALAASPATKKSTEGENDDTLTSAPQSVSAASAARRVVIKPQCTQVHYGGPYGEDLGGTFSTWQLPLSLAFALTIHKAQGLTMQRALLDLNGTFEYGQWYVALSRVATLAGLRLISDNFEDICAQPLAIAFYCSTLVEQRKQCKQQLRAAWRNGRFHLLYFTRSVLRVLVDYLVAPRSIFFALEGTVSDDEEEGRVANSWVGSEELEALAERQALREYEARQAALIAVRPLSVMRISIGGFTAETERTRRARRLRRRPHAVVRTYSIRLSLD